jgi:hypothetical protein
MLTRSYECIIIQWDHACSNRGSFVNTNKETEIDPVPLNARDCNWNNLHRAKRCNVLPDTVEERSRRTGLAINASGGSRRRHGGSMFRSHRDVR